SPGSPAATYLTPGTADVTDPTGQVVPLDALAECINPFDIPLDSIEVISHGVRSWGSGPIAQTYHRTLGPLAATAHRSVLVVLRLNPLDCADAVARRGGGAVGALRTATITSRRVAKRLIESGLRVSPLSGAEITAVTGQLSEGVALDDMTEQWDSIGSGQLRFRSAAIEPHSIGSVLSTVWVNSALSTTATVRLRHDADGVL
ncbi:type VII secretion protein EccE, partial [Streptomyces sp. SID10244]|nr:type VII secretion protein EccE [Streptomyces sp. SID10244]